jgi:hypothetical protein
LGIVSLILVVELDRYSVRNMLDPLVLRLNLSSMLLNKSLSSPKLTIQQLPSSLLLLVRSIGRFNRESSRRMGLFILTSPWLDSPYVPDVLCSPISLPLVFEEAVVSGGLGFVLRWLWNVCNRGSRKQLVLKRDRRDTGMLLRCRGYRLFLGLHTTRVGACSSMSTRLAQVVDVQLRILGSCEVQQAPLRCLQIRFHDPFDTTRFRRASGTYVVGPLIGLELEFEL